MVNGAERQQTADWNSKIDKQDSDFKFLVSLFFIARQDLTKMHHNEIWII